MTDEHFDQAFERMRTELNVTPSPEFVVKVRQQNEQIPARSSWSLWVWTGAAATCAAAVIAVALWRAPAPQSAAPYAGGTQHVSPPLAGPADQSTRGAAPAVVTARASRPGSSTRTPAIVTTPATTELEVLVPPDQLIAIRQLMSSLRTGREAQVAPPPTLIDPDTGKLMTLKPIEFPLIAVTPLPGDAERRSGGRENR